jgi:hypothetical protein
MLWSGVSLSARLPHCTLSILLLIAGCFLLQVGIVQTAYANGGSTRFIRCLCCTRPAVPRVLDCAAVPAECYTEHGHQTCHSFELLHPAMA